MIVGEKRSWFTCGLGKPVALLKKATSQPDASSGRGEKYKLPGGVRAAWRVRRGRDRVFFECLEEWRWTFACGAVPD